MQTSNIVINGIKDQLIKKVDRRDPSVISMSSLGHCVRSLAYRHHGIEGRPHSWRSMMIFNDGDLAHFQLRNLIEDYFKAGNGCHQLKDQEKEVELEGIVGHVDGLLIHDKDCKMEGPNHRDLLLEVKSMNDRAFKEIVTKGELGYEYRCQVSGYLSALELQYAVILCKNKNTGELAEFFYEVEDKLVLSRLAKIAELTGAEEPEDVGREYAPNAKGNLPWQCNYCPFVDLCWRDFGVMAIEKKNRKFYRVDAKLWKTYREAHDEEVTQEGCS